MADRLNEENQEVVGNPVADPLPVEEAHNDENREEEAKRFSLPNITTKATSWELPQELAVFLQERCNTYMSEKDLEEFLTTQMPINIKCAIKLDPLMKALLERKGFKPYNVGG